MDRYKYNLSQLEIWNNEIAFPSTNINVISARLFIREYDEKSVEIAVKKVLMSADIFSAKLVRDAMEGYFVIEEGRDYNYTILREMLYEELEDYVMDDEQQSLDCNELYVVEIIPVIEGGVMIFSKFHHLIMDGYSMTLYSQRILDALVGKVIVKSNFFETVICDMKMSDCEFMKYHKQFWSEYLRGAECSSKIFGEVTQGIQKKEYRQAISSTLEEKIILYAEQNELRLPYIYMAAQAIYLARATKHRDIMILMSRLGRTKEQMHILGCYVLVVPVRVSVDETDTFMDVYEKTITSANLASQGKNYGFDNILKIAREEEVSTEAISSNVYSYFRHKFDSELQFRLDVSAAAMHNDLTFNVVAFDKRVVFSLDLADKVYNLDKGKAFVESVSEILRQGIEGNQISEMEIVSKIDKEKILAVKGCEVHLNPEDTIVSLFEKSVEKHSQDIALYAGDIKLSFAELDVISNKIATGLRGNDVKAGDVISILLQRDERLIASILGVLKVGAIFVPIDTQYPEERIQYIIEDSKSKYLLSSGEVAYRSSDRLDVNELLQVENHHSEGVRISRDQVAYMIYTSGTMGNPKGVKIAHRGIVNIVQPENNPFNQEITRKAKGLVAVGSISFDISLFEIFVPLLNGLFIEIAPEEALADPKKIAKLIAAHNADVIHCTPSRLASYLKLKEFQEAFQNIKAVLSAGEVLYGSFVDEIRKSYGVKIFNGYGPTETTIGATITEAFDNFSIGKPIANTGIIILDSKNRILPYGAIGEMCIYGEGLGVGYQNLPELTAEKFIEFEGIRLYKTGDLGYINIDGKLMYRGRNDRQIKLRGLRIELEEIEQCISTIEGVSSVVCMVKYIAKQQHLVAYYDTATHEKLEEAVRAVLQSKLPYYMVPEVIVYVDKMPQTTRGKIDIKALGKIEIEIKKEYVAPTNETEALVCNAFAEIIGSEKIGIENNFFDVGGDSLSAAMLMFKLEELYGDGRIEVADIYRLLTPKNIAAKLLNHTDEIYENPLKYLDYDGFEKALKIPENIYSDTENLGNVLITGVTGYLGIHILIDLLSRPEQYNKIYCVARSKGKLSAKKRVLSTLYYFSETDFLEEYEKRWEVIEGDITQEDLYEQLREIKIDTVINSAANVAHFAKKEELECINTDSVKRLIEYCIRKNACLCQISTISVAGSVSYERSQEIFTEKNFYIGQEVRNSYLLSKYMAEYEMIRAHIDRGLAIKIMRVGNLQGRIQDGEFQMNMKSNAFSRRIISYIKLGAVPKSMNQSYVNFSPIDETAHMIVTLCTTANNQIAYNVYPPKEIKFSRIISILNELEFPIEVLDDREFKMIVDEAKKTEEGRSIVEGILIEKSNLNYSFIDVSQNYTQNILEVHREQWTEISESYLYKCFTTFTDMLIF